eukprot:jgi/Botrbrau1/3991/Bobra.0016s0004.1
MTVVKGESLSSLSTLDHVSPRWITRKCYIFVISFLFVAGWLAYLDRSSVSFGAQQFQKDLHLSSADYGLGTALFYIGYGTLQIPSNVAIMRLGAPLWLGVLLGLWGVVSLSSAFMKTRGHFFVLRFILGAIEAGYFPGAWYHMSHFFTSTELAFAFAAMSASIPFGQMLGAPIAAGILLMDGTRGIRGWQWIFLIEGSVTVAFAIVLGFFLPRSPSNAWFLKPGEQAWLSSRQELLLKVARERDPGAGAWHALLTTWKMWYLSFSAILIQFSVATIVYFNPLIVEAMFEGRWGSTAPRRTFATERESVLHEARIALISAILWVGVALAGILNGISTKYFQERNFHCAIPLAITGVCYMLVNPVLQNWGPIAGYAVLIVGASGVESITGPLVSWSKTFFYGHSYALSLAFMNSFSAIGGFTGPFVMGKLAGLPGGYSTAMIVMGCINLVNALLLFCFRPAMLEDQIVMVVGSDAGLMDNSEGHSAAVVELSLESGPEQKV